MRFRRNVILAYAFILVLGSLIIANSLDQIPQNAIKFEIISPNAEPGDIKLPNAVCFAKTSTSLLERASGGTVSFIRADNSPFLADNPQFTLNSFFDPESNKTVFQFGHFLKMRCEVGFNTASNPTTATGQNQLICEDPTKSEQCVKDNNKWIEVRPSNIEVHIYADDKSALHKRVYLKSFTTETVRLENGQEKNLLFAQIPVTDVLSKMDKGTYDSLVEFRTTGILNMYMQDFSIDGKTPALIKYYIGQNDIPTFFELKVTDNDGTPQSTTPIQTQEQILKAEQDKIISQDQQKSDANNVNTRNTERFENEESDSGDDSPLNDTQEVFTDLSICVLTLDTECMDDQRFTNYFIFAFIIGFLLAIYFIAKAFKGAKPIQ